MNAQQIEKLIAQQQEMITLLRQIAESLEWLCKDKAAERNR